MTTKTKVVFVFIMGLAAMIVAGVLLLENIGGVTLASRGGVSADIKVAVAPPLREWANAMALDFEAQNRSITVQIFEQKGLNATQSAQISNGDYDAWIAEADFIREMVSGVPYEEQGASVAQSSLVFIDVNGRVQNNLTWQTIHDSASDPAQWQTLSGGDFRFDAAIPSPANSVDGLAAYLSAAAAYFDTPVIDGQKAFDTGFVSWMNEIIAAVPEKTRAPVDQLSRPPVSVDVAVLSTSDLHKLGSTQFVQATPAYNVVFNFPYYLRKDVGANQVDNAENRTEAATLFRDYLLSQAAQSQLPAYGFNPANTPVTGQQVQVNGSIANRLRSQFQ